MIFENNFNNHSKEYIFLDNETLLQQRDKIFKKISQKKYDKKNNESLKNITISDLSEFDYFYKPENADPKISLIDIYRSIIPFVIVMCIGLAIVMIFPEIATWLPEYVSKR